MKNVPIADVASNSLATPKKPKKLGGCTGKGFMPGQSGNPDGRPKSAHISALYRKIFADPENLALLEARIMRFLRSKASSFSISDTYMLKEIADRIEGKVPTPVEVAASGSITIYDAVAKARARVLQAEAAGYFNRPALPESSAPVIDAEPMPDKPAESQSFPEWLQNNNLQPPPAPKVEEPVRRARRRVVVN